MTRSRVGPLRRAEPVPSRDRLRRGVAVRAVDAHHPGYRPPLGPTAPPWGWGPVLGRGRHLDPMRAAEALRLIRPRAAVPIHWGTYWPHALGRVLPARLVEPPAAFAEYAAELAPKVRMLPTAIGDVVTWEA